ncbi:uncharacterized protein LOC142326938 [Lycorma delicatula]|uniref:uncharacterized protein LOC142326938 n=1 Tax=Lycorma delicatula TaxID=130591 RepID=UPI003F516767
MYAAEKWMLNKINWSRLQIGKMKFLRSIAGKTRIDKVRNEDIREDIGMGSLRKKVEKGKLRWLGCVKRLDTGRISRRREVPRNTKRRKEEVMWEEEKDEGKRPREYPCKRRLDDMKDHSRRKAFHGRKFVEKKLGRTEGSGEA